MRLILVFAGVNVNDIFPGRGPPMRPRSTAATLGFVPGISAWIGVPALALYVGWNACNTLICVVITRRSGFSYSQEHP
jgi:hypothetical protein